MFRLLNQAVSNKCLQWWSFNVPAGRNGQHVLYFTIHKTKSSVDAVSVLVLALISHFAITTFAFSVVMQNPFYIFCNKTWWKDKRLTFWLKLCCKWWDVVFSSQAKARGKIHISSFYVFAIRLSCSWIGKHDTLSFRTKSMMHWSESHSTASFKKFSFTFRCLPK